MKKWLYPAVLLAVVGILARLPHPATDIAKLKPVRAVYLSMDGENLRIETDTGDAGIGQTLTAAAEDMSTKADGEIFLETAEFLIVAGDIPITGEFYAVFRPACALVFTDTPPDMESVAAYLSVHRPPLTLAKHRAR